MIGHARLCFAWRWPVFERDRLISLVADVDKTSLFRFVELVFCCLLMCGASLVVLELMLIVMCTCAVVGFGACARPVDLWCDLVVACIAGI
jgi:hypothetical protein